MLQPALCSVGELPALCHAASLQAPSMESHTPCSVSAMEQPHHAQLMQWNKSAMMETDLNCTLRAT